MTSSDERIARVGYRPCCRIGSFVSGDSSKFDLVSP